MAVYRCVRCKTTIEVSETDMRCEKCASRIFIKERAAQIKKLKAI
ncbi:MAG: TFIIB-type zinc ribbon-containing protein [Methermicoccaceae archaeon]